MGGEDVTLPVYCLYVIGAGYFILITMIVYLLYKQKYWKTRKVYNTFENDEQYVIQKLEFESNEELIGHLNKKNRECQNKVEYTIDSEGPGISENKITNKKNSADLGSKELASNSDRAIAMINKNSSEATIYMPPNIMKEICHAVLKKNTIKSANDEDSNEEAKTREDKNEQLNSEPNLLDKKEEKAMCISDLGIYDMVPSNKLVKVRISSYLDNRKSKKLRNSCLIIRDSANHYVFPMSTCTRYVNASSIHT